MNYNIDKLQEISSQLEVRITAINEFKSGESAFGEFMKSNHVNAGKLISLSETMMLVLNHGTTMLEGMLGVKAIYTLWKQRIDNKIAELKQEEFPSEINL